MTTLLGNLLSKLSGKLPGNSRVFNATVWQPLRAHPSRAALAMIAIALGVALGLAIFLMTRAATAETARASRSLFAQADYVIQGTSAGFDEALYPIIARLPGIAIASPVVEVRTSLIGQRTALIIMGREFLHATRRNAAAPASGASGARSRDALAFLGAQNIQLSATAAKTLQAKVGDTVTIQIGMQPVTLNVVAIVPSSVYPQDVGLMDIAAAQWKLGMLGKLSRIELNLTSQADTATVLAAIERVLPAQVKLTTPTDESHQVEQLLRPITINLLGVALVALFTGVFLVYSTQSLAIVRRRREFALLHALGVTAREQIASVICTGVLLGAIGALLGAGLGIALAKFGLAFIPGNATALPAAPLEIIAFAVLGLLASVAGSIAPALSAARIPTAQALKAGNVDERSGRSHNIIALLLWIAAVPLLFAPPLFDLPLLGYTGIACILFGAVLLIPSYTRFALRLLPRRHHVGYQVAIAQLRGVAHTATTSVATMLVSVSLMVAMSIMGASLRGSMAQWAQQMFPADLIVQMGYGSYLDTAAVAAITTLAGIERTEPLRAVPLLLSKEQAPVTLQARASDLLPLEASARRPLPQGAQPIWINRVLADREHLSPDDTLRFHLDEHEVVGSVRGIWRDYVNPTGALVLNYDQYRSLTGDERINSLSIWVVPGTSVESTRQLIRERMGIGVELNIALPGEIRARMLSGFDSLFAIIYLLLAVSVLIGLFGIGVNASAQVLARRAEFGVLRHLGFTRRQIGTVLTIEGLCLGTLGVSAGLAVGSVISTVMIYVVTPQSFHWTMDVHVPAVTLLTLAIAVPIAAALTALLSGRSAMNDDVVRAVKEDW
jgi:putative ABC transport system permease protein